MAKKKTVEGAEPVVEQPNAPEAQIENIEAKKTEEAEVETAKEETETVQVEQPTDDNKSEEKGDSATVATESQNVIPDYALDYFKRHPEEKQVYIDKLGGVFSANTLKVFLKDAVLYQNPFYKQ